MWTPRRRFGLVRRLTRAAAAGDSSDGVSCDRVQTGHARSWTDQTLGGVLMQRGGDSRAAAGVHARPTALNGLPGPTPHPIRARVACHPTAHGQDDSHPRLVSCRGLLPVIVGPELLTVNGSEPKSSTPCRPVDARERARPCPLHHLQVPGRHFGSFTSRSRGPRRPDNPPMGCLGSPRSRLEPGQPASRPSLTDRRASLPYNLELEPDG